MENKIAWLITCEHASNRLPKKYADLVPEEVLWSHRGFDSGAEEYASCLCKNLPGKLFCGKYTRLLIDLNRSLRNPTLFSEYSKTLSSDEKEELVRSLYSSFREGVENYIDRKKIVIHISCHSFTPQLHGKVRNVDIGILYDPQRASEKKVARFLQKELQQHTSLSVRLNAPYRGTSDGHTSALRLRFSQERYIGIEIEVNQKLLSKEFYARWKKLWVSELIQACREVESSCLLD